MNALEPRPGSVLSEQAIVLDKNAFGEADAVVHLLLRNHGRIVAVARGAQRSRKRFGGALEAMNFLQVQLRAPRERSANEETLWRLESVELKDSFLHLRGSLELLEAGVFAVRLLRDFLPESHVDLPVFRALGRYLRDALRVAPPSAVPWLRLAFWTWWAHHQGVGDLSLELEARLLRVNERLPQFWHDCLARDLPDFAQLAEKLRSFELPAFNSSDESRLYTRWVELSSMPWPHWERHLATAGRGYSL